MPISDATREDAAKLVARYPVSRSALLPLLHLVQAEEGYVSDDGIAFCAETLELTKAEVGAVATFYTMFKREPFGDYLLSVCTNPTCKIAGADKIYDGYVDACGGGQIDRDGSGVMVEHAECLGICDAAPVVQINYEMYGPVTHDEAMDLLAKAKAGDPPESRWSGEKPGTFAEVQRQLSGIEDGVDEQLSEAARLQVTDSAVPPAYRSGETDIPVTHPGGDPAGHGGATFRGASHIGDSRRQAAKKGVTAPEDVPDEQWRIKERLAESGVGVEAELAQQAISGRPPGDTPATQDQPPLDDAEATSAEAAGAPAAGVEREPGDSMAGEAGEQELEQPVGDRDVPAEDDTHLATSAGTPTPRDDGTTDPGESAPDVDPDTQPAVGSAAFADDAPTDVERTDELRGDPPANDERPDDRDDDDEEA